MASAYAPVHVRHTLVEKARYGDDQELRDYKNGCVLKARQSVVMVSPFISPDEKQVMQVLLNEQHPFILLADNGFSNEKTGRLFYDQLILGFQSGGYPLNKKDEYLALNGAPEDNPLIQSSKYVRLQKRNGLRIAPDFEKELFSIYPEISVEEGLRRAGLDPVDVGRNRIRKLEQDFREKAEKMYGETAKSQIDKPCDGVCTFAEED